MHFNDLTFKKKLEYIKDYYKAPIIAAALIIAVIIYFLSGYLTREKYDSVIIYAGGEYFGAEYAERISGLAELGIDADGDGEKKIKLDQFSYTDIQGAEYRLTMTLTLKSLINSGDPAVIWLDSERLSLVTADGYDKLMPASLWSALPSEDGYSVSLSDSAILNELEIDSDGLYMLVIMPSDASSLKAECTLKLARAIAK